MKPTTEIAHAVTARKGAFALLLGSGISRAAQVPTGWEVTQDLLASLAQVENGEPVAEPVAWYRSAFGEEPDYDAVIQRLYPSTATRQAALQRYFERAQGEQDPTRLRPTVAHQSIAALVASGVIKVIITTNFDRLIEDALAAANVHPRVLHAPEHVVGLEPLQHIGPLLWKIHGDYRDTRLRNTTNELGSYTPAEETLLDRILDEYGLIVVGWSGDWDVALTAAIDRCQSRRYPQYFTAYNGSLSPRMQELIDRRSGIRVDIEGADAFFRELMLSVEAIRSRRLLDPRDSRLLAARVRTLIDTQQFATLYDLILSSAEDSKSRVDAFPTDSPVPSHSERLKRIAEFDSISTPVDVLLATGVFFDSAKVDPPARSIYARALSILGRRQETSGYSGPPIPENERPGHVWPLFQLYPAVRALYAAGVAAIAAARFETLNELLHAPVNLPIGTQPAASALKPTQAIGSKSFPIGIGPTAIGLHLRETLWRDIFQDLLKDGTAYREAFDRFELLAGLASIQNGAKAWVPTGLTEPSSKWEELVETMMAEAFKQEPASWNRALNDRVYKKDIEDLVKRARESLQG